MARPTLTSDRHRVHRIVFRLTSSEYECLLEQALQLGHRVNELARMLVISSLEVGEDERTLDPAFVTGLNYIGHNLNQITKRMHMTGRLSPSLTALCERIEALIDEATAKEFN
ncbi:hypothetical protein JIN85_13955 [Luteolibacter pohnpeiensis]|uniref:Bacterial mobilisation domain-containing protein n=1 Tax=Luteolibacter pohnpeiensis TaxID=454153 RepID=A0A934S5L1_9BACT|nr:hypothetical protein [Luteolibacter pohnpeiensis]MBK1883525.1 hypothetical protein [Luteolibacter pohnpeiensis]